MVCDPRVPPATAATAAVSSPMSSSTALLLTGKALRPKPLQPSPASHWQQAHVHPLQRNQQQPLGLDFQRLPPEPADADGEVLAKDGVVDEVFAVHRDLAAAPSEAALLIDSAVDEVHFHIYFPPQFRGTHVDG